MVTEFVPIVMGFAKKRYTKVTNVRAIPTHAPRLPSPRRLTARLTARAACVVKMCQILGKVETPGTQRTGCGMSLTDASPDSSYVNGFSTDLSLFDSLEIQYIIHWSIDKKLLPGVI